MNARRKHRIFADHKPPLVAFFVVAMTSVMLLVHVARSEAAPSWLRQGVASVVAGGAPLAQQVMSGTLVEPAPANAEPPAGPGTAAGQAANAHQEEQPAALAASPASSATVPPSTHTGQPGRGPRPHQHGHAAAADPAGPPSNPPSAPHPTPPTVPVSPGPGESPYPTTPGHGPPGHGPHGHGVLEALGHLLGHHGDGVVDAGHPGYQAVAEGPVRGSGHTEHDQHSWLGVGWHEHGHGDEHGHGHGHRGHGHH